VTPATPAPLAPAISAPAVSAHVASPSGAEASVSSAASRNSAPVDPPAASVPDPASDPTGTKALVNSAQLTQSGGHSEIHVALQSDSLGSVELHARVSGDSVGAAITVDKRDAHTALAADLPALQQALSDKQLRVDQISLLHAPLNSTAGSNDGGAAQHFGAAGQQGSRQSSAFSRSGLSLGAGDPAGFSALTVEPGEIFDSQGRLSVHA
jgi:flagellar hook-length control protein FliK